MGESILIHACAYRTVIYSVVIVSRNLERANEKGGFKMTALEFITHNMDLSAVGYIDIPLCNNTQYDN